MRSDGHCPALLPFFIRVSALEQPQQSCSACIAQLYLERRACSILHCSFVFEKLLQWELTAAHSIIPVRK